MQAEGTRDIPMLWGEPPQRLRVAQHRLHTGLLFVREVFYRLQAGGPKGADSLGKIKVVSILGTSKHAESHAGSRGKV